LEELSIASPHLTSLPPANSHLSTLHFYFLFSIMADKDQLQHALDGINALAMRVKQDRRVLAGSRDIFLTSHVVGIGFLPGAREEGLDEDQEQSLFVHQDEEFDDAAYEDAGDSEDKDGMDTEDDGESSSSDTANWLNGLARYIVSNGHRPICHSDTDPLHRGNSTDHLSLVSQLHVPI
jgi:hypothetical protein